jgi:hypothetical protein
MTEPDERASALAEYESRTRRADDLLRRFALREYRADGANAHLTDCPDAAVAELDSQDGSYGCETGCDYLTLTVTVTCSHDETEEFSYGEFGDLARIIEALEREASA